MFKECLKRSTAIAAGLVGFVCVSAQGAVIVDPQNIGKDSILRFPVGGGGGESLSQSDIAASPDLSDYNLVIGAVFSGAADLELNTLDAPNPVTSLNIGRLSIGAPEGETSLLRIVGAGSDAEAVAGINVIGDSFFGSAGDAAVEFLNSAEFNTGGFLSIGNTDDANVSVDEFSSLSAGHLVVGGPDVNGRQINALLSVFNGGRVFAQENETQAGIVRLGSTAAGEGASVINIDGAGSELTFDGSLLVQAFDGITELNITNGARVREGLSNGADGVVIRGVNSQPVIRVAGSGSSLSSLGNIIIGDSIGQNGALIVEDGGRVFTGQEVYVSASNEDGGMGELTVSSGGQVAADVVHILSGGVLNGDGGVIIGDVVVNGGTIAPGNSPGVTTIDGDLTFMSAASLLEIEFESENTFDILNVTGDLLAGDGFTLELSFLDGFIPEEGSVFSFLNVEGMTLADLTMVDIIVNGLGDEFDIALHSMNGVFSIAASATAISEAPIPGAGLLLLTGIGGFAAAKRKKRLS